MIITILLILLIAGAFGGPFYGAGYAPYANYGYGFGGLLVIVLIVLLVLGRL